MSLYPLSEKAPDRLRTPGGLPYNEITLDAVLDGRVRMEDLRVTPEALELQAQVAEAAGRGQLADNLRRAAELAKVPEEFILEVYNSLRPGRADAGRLAALAAQLEERHAAQRCAALVREAAGIK
jgi:propanediol dehydratase small subunit